MTSIAELETPAVTIDVAVMEDNVRRIQAHLDRHGIAARPHIKTHKIPALGKLQMKAGAAGIPARSSARSKYSPMPAWRTTCFSPSTSSAARRPSA